MRSRSFPSVVFLSVLVSAQYRAPPSYRPPPSSRNPSAYRLDCRVDDPLSCSQEKSEVCVFADGGYRCECPHGINRLGDGRCLLTNECAKPSSNGCHKHATCIDLAEGYTCECQEGFADVSSDRERKPGRLCQKTADECSARETYGVDCDESAACVDTPDGFQCVCQPGYTDISTSVSRGPGRKCVMVVNECLDGSADCSPDAICTDRADGYECRCKAGFVDASPEVSRYPGRVCNRPHSPEYYGQQAPQIPMCRDTESCSVNEECLGGRCECVSTSTRGPDGVCRDFNRCEAANECDRNAICSNTFEGFRCQCKSGYRDASPDPLLLPGRRCEQRCNRCIRCFHDPWMLGVTNECSNGQHDCSPLAVCEDTPDSFICRCQTGTTDVSSRYSLKPGRRCTEGNNACSSRSLNSCDDNSDCVQLPDTYTCKCFAGYVDVSSNANLPPGRVCTLQTTCPSQPTDLVFLIDGSGSIGSFVFENEVLRFLSEFTDLFDISPSRTRVSVVQFSDQIRHEFGLGDSSNSQQVHDAIRNIQYLTGLTRTGAAIEHVVNEAFSTSRGARPNGASVARVCIVITDGRSQDNVTIPATNARRQKIQMFAIGVTNHVLDSELETIAGDKTRTFHVNAFEDLNTRLRSLIQKVACPANEPQKPTSGPCDPSTHAGCDRSLNQVCIVTNGRFACGCPKGFEIHPVTQVCGGDLCNPELSSTCPYPEVCEKTPFGNWRCSCAEGTRDNKTGICKPAPMIPDSLEQQGECDVANSWSCPNGECTRSPSGESVCNCREGFEKHPQSNKCVRPGACDPLGNPSCDPRKKEQCLPGEGGIFTCQCAVNFRRHPVTQICLMDECSSASHDCAPGAQCTDTDDGFMCACPLDFIDKSPDLASHSGRVCERKSNECMEGTHNCSINAVCIDLPEGFLCRCKDKFVDMSPNPSAFAGTECRPLVDECSLPSMNNCSENALCIDTRDSYKCQCKQGFVDQDELRNPGRDCKKLNTACESGRNDCSVLARCIERGVSEFECVCPVGFLDKSPDPNKPGRKCIENVCSDRSKNDCDELAVCQEKEGSDKFTCQCRDGYMDASPSGRPGRVCKQKVNECLDSSLNDCDPLATCKDLPEGFTCTCPVGSRDDSPTTEMPGRRCTPLVNECRNPHLNNCSRFADCHDKEEGYECRCKSGYHDESPATPGVNCKFMLNECQSPNLNNCHAHADCIDKDDGYQCKCKAPFQDTLPQHPGTLCTFNECDDPKTNDCAAEARCIDMDDGYTCECKEGFFDDGSLPGRVCQAFTMDEPPTEEATTINPNKIRCGHGFCDKSLGEVCVSGSRCECRPGEARVSGTEKCEKATEVRLAVRVTEKSGEPLHFSSQYGNPTSPVYIEVLDNFVRGVGDALHKTAVSPKYIGTKINYITSPKVENSTWDDGLLVNSSILLRENVDACDLFANFSEGLQKQGLKLSHLKVASDYNELQPCKPETPMGEACGLSGPCRVDLGEECIGGRLCVCRSGQKRPSLESACRVVEEWQLPLYVIRDGSNNIHFTPNLANPITDKYKDLVSRFEKGMGESYGKTPLKSAFVSAEVNDVSEPRNINASWDEGVLVNVTISFVKGAVGEPKTVFTDLIEYVQKKNNYEIGHSRLFLSPEQLNPFSACYRSDCDSSAICTEDGNGHYSCKCPSGSRDLNPEKAGRQCLSIRGTNECEKPELNECSADARCIDLDWLYKCECVSPYVNSAGPDEIPGSSCTLDYCSDVNFCPANSTCKNVDQQAQCVCLAGFVDIRKSSRLGEAGLGDAMCLRSQDIDECALGLHNCSSAAVCTDKRIGYECRCLDGYTDGNPAEPGRICAAPSCGMCQNNGACIHDSLSQNVTCACLEGYSGEFCEIGPSSLPLWLMLLLALLFLLLTLLCCTWLLTHCRCFNPLGSSGSASGQEMLASDYYTIPRAKLKPAYGEEIDAGRLGAYLDDGASLSSDGSVEEIERRVTTDVTTREIRTTTVTDEEGHTQTSRSETITHSPLETHVDQFAVTSSDHSKHAIAGGASSAIANDGYESESASEVGDAQFDRRTRVTQSHDFEPGASKGTGVERRTNEISSTTTSKEVNYF